MTDETVEIHKADLLIVIEMMTLMYEVIHEDQPKCEENCDAPPDLVVELESGQIRNITRHVPLVIDHLYKKLEEEDGEE